MSVHGTSENDALSVDLIENQMLLVRTMNKIEAPTLQSWMPEITFGSESGMERQ